MQFLNPFRKKYLEFKVKLSNKTVAGRSFDSRLLRRTVGKSFPSSKQLLQIKRVLSPLEKNLFKVACLLVLFGFVWAGIVFVVNHSIQSPKIGGTFIEAEVGSPQLINPIFAQVNDVDRDISRLVYSGLMRYDQKLRLVSDLAVKYSLSQDKKTYTFELRKDILWHDGEKFTAKDVVFTINAIQNPVVGSPLVSAFQGVTVKAVDDYTVQFTLTDPYSSFLSALIVGMLPEHVWFNVEPGEMRYAIYNLKPVGTGPFRYLGMSKDASGHIYQYNLQRNDTYYRQPAYLKEFIFQFFATYDGTDGALQAFLEQKVNAVSFVPYNLRDKINRKHIDIHVLKLPQYAALFFNDSHKAQLKDKNIRLALNYAVDKERIVKEVLKNGGQAIYGPLLPGSLGYLENTTSTYSQDQANKLLDQKWPRVGAGDFRNFLKDKMLKDWKDGQPKNVTTTEQMLADVNKQIEDKLNQEVPPVQSFFRKNKDGEVLELTLTTVDDEQYKKVAELTASFWRDIGVKVNLKFVSSHNVGIDVLKSRDYDVLFYGEIVGSDPDPYPFWHSSQINFPGLNLSRYVNSNADSIIEKARVSSDSTEQAILYQKFNQLIVADVPAVFLYIPTYTYATTDNIQGIDVERIASPDDRFAGVINWYMVTGWSWKK